MFSMAIIGKRADMGIGTLIIFIAMIMVASITASVLIQTATSLQSKALQTGRDTQRAISTVPTLNSIVGVDISSNAIMDLRVDMKLSPGSEGLDLSKAMLSLELNDVGYTYVYNNGSCINDSATGYSTNQSDTNGTFTVKYLVRGSNNHDGYLGRGDIVELCFASGRKIVAGESASIKFVPQLGIPISTDFYMPNIISGSRKRLYP